MEVRSIKFEDGGDGSVYVLLQGPAGERSLNPDVPHDGWVQFDLVTGTVTTGQINYEDW